MSEIIPQSNALSEATTDSLAELMGRDPFKFTTQDRGVIVAALREQRKRWEAAEAANASKPKTLRGAGAKSLVSASKAEDLGL